jgi:hypothetical protein
MRAKKYSAHPKEDLLEVLAGTKVIAFERNAVIYSLKSKWWRIALIFLIAAVVTFLVGRGIEQWR